MNPITLFSWIGMADLQSARNDDPTNLGPIAQAVEQTSYDRVFLLNNFKVEDASHYQEWLVNRFNCKAEVISTSLSSPTSYSEIFTFATEVVKGYSSDRKYKRTFHLSPGTPAMAAVWIILAKTEFPAELIESSAKHGVRTVDFPFDIAADFLPSDEKIDEDIVNLSLSLPPQTPEFDYIIHTSSVMKQAVARARVLAQNDVNVLIMGESGTGKELFARAIHAASRRADNALVAVNCGAIPKELVESEFFGHKKGSFSGAINDHAGYLEQADGGTLFLDEIGELPLSAQVKLLRAVQEGVFSRVGDGQPRQSDFRIIAATNRDLLNEVAESRFREDLFHRIAIGVMKLPPLRDRKGDMNLLIDHFLTEINQTINPHKHKDISASARNILIQHEWGGNIRELKNTLVRAAIWSTDEKINKRDVEDSFLTIPNSKDDRGILNLPLDKGLDVQELMAEVAKHYIERAYEEAGENKTKAAKMLGFNNYQTFSNWMKKYL